MLAIAFGGYVLIGTIFFNYPSQDLPVWKLFIIFIMHETTDEMSASIFRIKTSVVYREPRIFKLFISRINRVD